MRNLTDRQKIALGIVSVVMVSGLIWYGFSSSISQVNQCTAIVKKYVIAEYSETTYSTCTDSDGNVYSCSDTDYWSEPASEIFIAVTTNGEFSGAEWPTTIQYGAHYPPMPPHNTRMRKSYDFDNFSFKTVADLKVHVTDEMTGESSEFSDPISKNPRCVEKLNQFISVKTWYAITYGSEF